MVMKAFLLTLVIMMTFTSQLNLIPAKNFPFMVEKPTANDPELKLVAKFSFPKPEDNQINSSKETTRKVTFFQYIGIQFPTSLKNVINFDEEIFWACEFSLESDSNQIIKNTINYKMEAVKPEIGKIDNTVLAEDNIAYCKFSDPTNDFDLEIGLVYTFKFKISPLAASSIIYRGFSLFTSTSNTPEKIIIDYLPLLGSFAIDREYASDSNNEDPLGISLESIVTTSGPELFNPIPGNKIDVVLTLVSPRYYFSKDDYLYVFKYTKSNVLSLPSSINMFIYDNSKVDLSFRKINDDSWIIDGLQLDIISNRNFRINLVGVDVLNRAPLEESVNIRIEVYYKNTYSLVSFSELSGIIAFDSVPLTVTANHPEFWDIYRNGAWPIQFSFQSPIDISDDNGFYVVVRQKDPVLDNTALGNYVTFLASTCDFSENSSIDNDFGVRKNCFALKLDQKMESSVEPSGIFFHHSGSITKETLFYFTVWVFADNCAGDSFNNLTANAKVTPSFEVLIINDSYLNKTTHNKFDFTKNMANGNADFQGNCWNNKIHSFSLNPGEDTNKYGDNNFGLELSDDLITGPFSNLTIKFKEIFSWRIGSITTSTTTNGYLDDMNTFPEKFIYSQTNDNKITNSSFFLAEADLTFAAGSDLRNGLPGQYISDGINANGFLTVQFSKNWFVGNSKVETSSTDKCYLSWGINEGASNSKVLETDTSTPGDSRTNFLGISYAGHEINIIDSSLPTTHDSDYSSSNIMKLVSSFNDAATSTWKYFIDEQVSTTEPVVVKVAWFTNCVNWNIPTSIKSLFTYIDIQFIWTYLIDTSDTDLKISSVTRLIKLFPEGGVFNDKSKFSNAITTNPYINHVVIQDDNLKSAVCLIELDGASIKQSIQGDTEANAFALWLGFGVLLETDYSDAAAQYPVGNIDSTVKTYGLQSQTPMNLSNLYINRDKYQFVSSDPDRQQTLPLISLLNQIQNPASLGLTTETINKGEFTSSYHFLMGSLLLFTNLNNRTIQSTTNSVAPIYIPYYCPFNYCELVETKEELLKNLHFFPSLFGAWLNISSHDNISKTTRYLSYGEENKKMAVILSKVDSSKTIKTSFSKGSTETTVANIRATNRIIGLLRWKAYDDTNNNTIEVYNGFNGKTDNADVTCTGFSLFLEESVTIQTQNLSSNFINNAVVASFSSDKFFYVNGAKFKKAVFGGGLTGTADTTLDNLAAKDVADSTIQPNFTISGISRPNLETYLTDGKVSNIRKALFSCVPAHVTKYDALVNYETGTENIIIYLDFKPFSKDTTITLKLDNPDISIADTASNILMTITLPGPIIRNSMIEFKSNEITDSTVCGFKYQDNFSVDFIEYSSENGMKFSVPYTGSEFEICCYNLVYSTKIVLDTFSIESDTSVADNNLTGKLVTTLYNKSNISLDLNLGNTVPKNIIGESSATVQVDYTLGDQISGIGKINFSINLPRGAVRNMKLSIIRDFSDLVVGNITPRCHAQFLNLNSQGYNWNGGDAILDGCLFYDGIHVSTKLIVYKCGQSFSNVLNVSLWPVKIINWNDTLVNSKFTVNLKNLSDDSDIALSDDTQKFSLDSTLKAKPLRVDSDNLCNVIKIDPIFPGFLSDYEFEIELPTSVGSGSSYLTVTALNNAIKAANPNEIFIFWPYNLYGSFIQNVVCENGGIFINCTFIDEGILSIKFDSVINFDSKVVVKVIGVPNPELVDFVEFACTLNNYDKNKGTRSTLVTSTGFTEEKFVVNDLTANEALVFRYHPESVDNRTTRNSSTHNFNVGLYKGFDNSKTISELSGTPIIHLLFPEEYKFAWNYKALQVEVKEYLNSQFDLPVVGRKFDVDSVTTSGNRVKITLSDAKITLDNEFLYFNIKIKNVENPMEDLTTGSYSVIITNSSNSYLYSTVSNVNNYTGNILKNDSGDFLNWNKGNEFDLDKNFWTLHIVDNKRWSEYNKLYIKPGRYTQAQVRYYIHDDSTEYKATTKLSLNDPIFKTYKTSYDINTTSNSWVHIMIGAPCGTAQGNYLSQFTIQPQTHFKPLAKVLMIVEKSIENIEISDIINIPAGAQFLFSYTISNFNFDPLNINWASDSGNNANSSITNFIIPKASISDERSEEGETVFGKSIIKIPKTVSSKQTFTVTDPNICWTLNDVSLNGSKLIITVSGAVPVFPDNFKLSDYLKLADFQTDPINSIRFVFEPPLQYQNLYCALTCINNDFPSDADIIAPKTGNSPLLQFYSEHQITKGLDIPIVFDNLVRGMKYKLKCIIETIHAEEADKIRQSQVFEKMVVFGSDSKDTRDIYPTASNMNRCVKFNFTRPPSDYEKYSIIDHCQSFYSPSNTKWTENGCVICTNHDNTVFSPGYYFSENITCNSSNKLRFLQATSNRMLNKETSNSFTVCPVTDRLCPTDAVLNSLNYSERFELFVDDIIKNNKLKDYGITTLGLPTENKYVVYDDANNLSDSKLTAEITKTDIDGVVVFIASSPSAFYCNWLISSDTEENSPSFDTVKNCKSEWCGNLIIDSANTIGSTNNNRLKKFEQNVTYNLFFACTNNVYDSQTNYAVKLMDSFEVNPVAPLSSGFMSYSLMLLFLIISLLV